MSAILILWLTSCTNTPKNETPKTRITPPDPYTANGDLVIKYIPDGETVTADGDAVLLPYWYWEKICDYIVDTQSAQDIADINNEKN